jgi:hypothetical protein
MTLAHILERSVPLGRRMPAFSGLCSGPSGFEVARATHLREQFLGPIAPVDALSPGWPVSGGWHAMHVNDGSPSQQRAVLVGLEPRPDEVGIAVLARVTGSGCRLVDAFRLARYAA